jgi:hypothetical protein
LSWRERLFKKRLFSTVDFLGRTIWIADEHRDDGKRFVVRADEKLTAFIELERAIQCPSRHNTAIRIN